VQRQLSGQASAHTSMASQDELPLIMFHWKQHAMSTRVWAWHNHGCLPPLQKCITLLWSLCKVLHGAQTAIVLGEFKLTCASSQPSGILYVRVP
jgi:hypothetical protein